MNEQTLFERLGGKDAINAAVDIFYEKVLADVRINHLFKDTDINRQRAKQKAFMTYAFGGAPNYEGESMRRAHAHLDLNEGHFNAVAENLVVTLKGLNVAQDLINETISIIATTKNDILNV